MDIAINNVREEQRLQQLIFMYCEAVDGQDWKRVRTCFSKDAIIKHGTFVGSVNDFLEFVVNVISKSKTCVHYVGRVEISLEGGIAVRTTHFTSIQQFLGEHVKIGPVLTNGFDTEWRVKGRYIDKLKKVDGVWKVFERLGYNDHSETIALPAKSEIR